MMSSPEAANRLVWCVQCVLPGDEHDAVHIFSSQAAAISFCNGDSRRHIVYDYVIDNPERMEQTCQ